MAGVKVEFQRQKEFRDALGRLERGYTKGIAKALLLSAHSIRTEAIKSIQKGGGPGESHTPSAPGQPPNTDTGRLVASIFAEIESGGLGARVGTDVRYGRYLEFGTSRMAARPWLFPAFSRKKDAAVNRVRKAMEIEGRKAGKR